MYTCMHGYVCISIISICICMDMQLCMLHAYPYGYDIKTDLIVYNDDFIVSILSFYIEYNIKHGKCNMM